MFSAYCFHVSTFARSSPNPRYRAPESARLATNHQTHHMLTKILIFINVHHDHHRQRRRSDEIFALQIMKYMFQLFKVAFNRVELSLSIFFTR
jgi:hypothetical protein